MSASDKKQQRKAALVEGLTQKQRQEQLQAKAAKQKKTVYTIIGVACAVVAVALLIWNNMGTWQERSHQGATAAIVGDENYSVADLQYYYNNVRNSYYQYASMLGYNYDTTVSEGAQWYDEAENKTYADFFRESALNNLKQTAVLCAAAKAEGYTLSEEGQNTIDNNLSQINVVCAQYGLTRSSYFSQQYGVSEKVFLRNFTNDVLADEYSQAYQDRISYDDAALKEYYNDHASELDSYDYRIFTVDGSVPTTDADGNTVEVTDEQKADAMAQAKAQADMAVAEISAADDVEEAFINAAREYVSDDYKEAYALEGYSLNRGIPGSILSSNGAAVFPWLSDSARKSNDVTAIETATGYQIVLFLDRYLVTDPTVDVRHILIQADIADGATEPTQEAMDAAKAEAQSLLDQWNAGEKTADSFAELANEHSDDGGSNTNGGLYTYVYKNQMVPNFNDWCFDPARKPGDAGLVENNGDGGYYGWHVIYFDKENGVYWEKTATSAKQSTDHSEWLTSLTDAAEAVAANAMKYVGPANTAVPTTPAPAESETPTESPEA